MKIALITDNGKTLSQHFGRAPYYLVVEIQDGQITSRQLREKLGHQHFHNQAHEEYQSGERHGFGVESHNRHAGMAEAIADCEMVICGGMGAGAFESMRRLNIQPVLTELKDVDEILKAHLDGRLANRTDLLH